jgi:multiple sugar transport system substrate-binding protein
MSRGVSRLRLVAACMLCAACGTSSGANDKVTLRFWGLGREGEVVATLMDDFEREHPNIAVHVQQIPWTAAHEKLLTAQVGGSSPDVAQLGNTWIAEFAAINALEPLNKHITQSATIKPESFFPGIWATNVVGDQVFGIPWYVDTRVLFYRTDLLRAAGYDSMPQNWADWLAAMRAIKRNVGADRYAIYLPTNEWTQPIVFGMQNGATILRADGRYGAFREPAYASAFDFYVTIYREDLAPLEGLYDIANPYQEFERGYFAMWITGPWNIGEFKRRLPPDMQDKWATAALPGPRGAATGTSTAGGASLVVFRDSEHKDAAWQLIEFLSRPEQQARFYELTGSLPARREAWTMSRLADDPHAKAFWTQLQRVVALPAVPEIESIMSRVIEHSESAIRGNRPNAAALAALDADVDAMLEKRRWVMQRQAAQ